MFRKEDTFRFLMTFEIKQDNNYKVIMDSLNLFKVVANRIKLDTKYLNKTKRTHYIP